MTAALMPPKMERTMNAASPRRKRPKGQWMRLRDPKLLQAHMEHADYSQARLGRHAETSRQFIHKLVSGEARTCTPRAGQRIEEALNVLPGTLFVLHKSDARRVPRQAARS